jgi:hypothetical protein
MAKPQSRTLFRSRLWLRLATLLAAMLFAGVAAYFRMRDGWSAFAVLGTALAGFAAAGFVQTLLTYVHLHDDALVVSSGFRRRRYERAVLESVTWEGGSGVAIRLVDGSWLKLPELGYNSQSLCNSIRAWLRRTEAAKPNTL